MENLEICLSCGKDNLAWGAKYNSNIFEVTNIINFAHYLNPNLIKIIS